jgi:heme/copper-type cytochrome/quinol oxidase subunit 2
MSPAVGAAVFWIAAACCLVAQIAVIRSAVRAPMPGSPNAAVTMPRRSIEIAWTIIPAIVLMLVLISTWRAMHPAAPGPIMIMPNGHPMLEK